MSYSDKYPLWEKQQEAITRSIKRLRKSKGVCLLCDPGTGKTRITIEALEYLFRAKDARLIYIVAPLTAMHVWIEEWHKWAMAPVAFIDLHESGSPGLRYAKKLAAEGWPVICLVNYEASWQIGHSYVERTRKGEKVRIHEKTDTAMFDLDWDAGVMDECFVPGTSIDTPKGHCSIENLKVGQLVDTPFGVRPVTHLWRRKVSQLCEVAVGGRVFYCSLNHPFWVMGQGWVAAKDIKQGDMCALRENMPSLQTSFPGQKKSCRSSLDMWVFLWDALEAYAAGLQRKIVYQGKHPKTCVELEEMVLCPDPRGESCHIPAYEGEQPLQNEPGVTSPAFRETSSYGAQAPGSRGEWPGIDGSPGDATKRSWGGLGSGVHSALGEKPKRLPHALQAGLSVSRLQVEYRSGRAFTRHPETTGARSKEGYEAGGVRVDSATVLQPNDPRIVRYRGADGMFNLWDIEVAGARCFYVEGILVHNCDATKTPGAKVSKFFRHKMRDKTDYRMILTGTAYTKRPLDVWAPVNYACKDEVFPKVFLPFKNMYSIPHPQIRGAVVGYQNLNDFTWRLSQIAILLKKEDMFDLPPQIHQTRMVELSSKSRRLYDTLKAEAYAELEESGDTITANHIFTAMRKLMQVTSGFVIPDVDDPEAPIEAVRLGKEKLAELMELLDTRGEGPVIIVTQANEEERIIAEALRKAYDFVPKVLNGSVKGAENRHRMIAEAANDRAFIVKESVGARGVDMRWADTTIFFSHSYNTSAYQQMLSRNHRGGQEKSITYYHLLCRDTIDIAVWGALRRDLNLAASIERDWRKLFE